MLFFEFPEFKSASIALVERFYFDLFDDLELIVFITQFDPSILFSSTNVLLYGVRDIKTATLERASRTFYSSCTARSHVNAPLGRHRLGNSSRTRTIRFDFEVFTMFSRAYCVLRYSAESYISVRIHV